MIDTTISAKLRILTPEDGMALTDGTTYTTGTIYLAHSADASRWHEIPESEIPPTPEPPKGYDVYRLILALKSLDVTLEGQTMKAIVPAVEWIKSQGLYEEFLTIRTIRADDTDLMAAISTLASVLGVTDAQVAEIMESAEVG